MPAVDTSSSALSCRAAEKPPLVVGTRCVNTLERNQGRILLWLLHPLMLDCFVKHAEEKAHQNILILTKIFREINNPKVKRITAATVEHILLMQSTIHR